MVELSLLMKARLIMSYSSSSLPYNYCWIGRMLQSKWFCLELIKCLVYKFISVINLLSLCPVVSIQKYVINTYRFLFCFGYLATKHKWNRSILKIFLLYSYVIYLCHMLGNVLCWSQLYSVCSCDCCKNIPSE